jgi:uncharacterized protein YgiM (DUF1202 family)
MKKTFILLLLLALAVGFYVMAASAIGAPELEPTQTAQPTVKPSQTPKPGLCLVRTGIDGGTVNLRVCAGTSCAVLDILTEGESLTIVTAGLWTQITTEDGVTGWLNSNYCKGK